MTEPHAPEDPHDKHLPDPPNFTMTPNVFLDHWMPILSPAEFKTLMCITRKTLGWGKIRDNISLTQIVVMTGLSKAGVASSLNALSSYKLIIRDKNASDKKGNEPTTYTIKFREPCENKGEVSDRGGSPINGQALDHSVDTQKKDLTKYKKLLRSKEESEPISKPVVVPSFLSEIEGLTIKSIKTLLREFTEAELEVAARQIQASTVHIDNPFGWLRSCVVEGYEVVESKDRIAEKNIKWWDDTCKRYEDKTFAGVRVDRYREYVHFLRGGVGNAGEVFEFKSPNFKQEAHEKLKEIIRLSKE